MKIKQKVRLEKKKQLLFAGFISRKYKQDLQINVLELIRELCNMQIYVKYQFYSFISVTNNQIGFFKNDTVFSSIQNYGKPRCKLSVKCA